MSIVDNQLVRLAERYPRIKVTALPSQTRLVVIPDHGLPDGWNTSASSIRFLVPSGYPFAPPDCFWTDEGLRLADGRLPQNTVPGNPIPEVPGPGLWFSWHIASVWNPNRDTLSTWMNSINDRLGKLV